MLGFVIETALKESEVIDMAIQLSQSYKLKVEMQIYIRTELSPNSTIPHTYATQHPINRCTISIPYAMIFPSSVCTPINAIYAPFHMHPHPFHPAIRIFIPHASSFVSSNCGLCGIE
jgi:hypothetical protein